MKNFLLIVGAPRSGTTLLSNMLSAHPDIYIFPQTQFFNKIWGARHIYNFKNNRYKMLNVISKDKAVKRSKLDLFHNWNNLRNKFDNYFQEYIDLVNDYNISQKKYIGDKSPRHTMLAKNIKKNLPASLKIIAINRDSRAVLASMKAGNLIKNVASGAAIWNTYSKNIAKLSNFCPAEDLILLRYEDIVTNPKQCAKMLSGKLGIPYSDKMIEIKKNNSSFVQNNKKGIYNNSLKMWKVKLFSDEIDIITVLTKRYLNYFGYEANEDIKKKISMGSKAAYYLSSAEELLIITLIKAGFFPGALLPNFLKSYLGRP